VNFGGSSFAYDVNGNVISDGLRTYRWDAENRLLSVTVNNQLSTQTSFRYDGTGRRIGIVSSNQSVVQKETRYLWCADALCQARDSSDSVVHRYYPEGELSSSGALYYAQDQLGSIRDLVGGQTGNTVASFDYDPYGNITSATGSVLSDFRYAGLFYDKNSGLYLAERRAFDPRTGRWLSRDPIGERAGANLYSYVSDSPASAVDPLGAFDLFGFGGATFGPRGFVRPSGEGLGLVGYSSSQGPYVGGLGAVGFETGGQSTYGGYFTGTESTVNPLPAKRSPAAFQSQREVLAQRSQA